MARPTRRSKGAGRRKGRNVVSRKSRPKVRVKLATKSARRVEARVGAPRGDQRNDDIDEKTIHGEDYLGAVRRRELLSLLTANKRDDDETTTSDDDWIDDGEGSPNSDTKKQAVEAATEGFQGENIAPDEHCCFEYATDGGVVQEQEVSSPSQEEGGRQSLTFPEDIEVPDDENNGGELSPPSAYDDSREHNGSPISSYASEYDIIHKVPIAGKGQDLIGHVSDKYQCQPSYDPIAVVDPPDFKDSRRDADTKKGTGANHRNTSSHNPMNDVTELTPAVPNNAADLGRWFLAQGVSLVDSEGHTDGNWLIDTTILTVMQEILCNPALPLFQDERYDDVDIIHVDTSSGAVLNASDASGRLSRNHAVLIVHVDVEFDQGYHYSLAIVNAAHKQVHVFDTLQRWHNGRAWRLIDESFPNINFRRRRFRLANHTGHPSQLGATCGAWACWLAIAYAVNFGGCRSATDNVDTKKMQDGAVEFWRTVTF